MSIVSTKQPPRIELVGTNTIRSLDPDPTRSQPYHGSDGISGIFAYSGACFAPNLGSLGSILKFGGGDADYWGNQVYVFDIAGLTWTQLYSPTTTPFMDGQTGQACLAVGSQSGTTLTITAITSGAIVAGQQFVQFDGSHFSGPHTTVAAFGTAGTTGTGGTGTYSVSTSNPIGSGTTLYFGDPNYDYVHAEFGDGNPATWHTYNLLQVVPGGTGGKGRMVGFVSQYVYFDLVNLYSHVLDLGAVTQPAWSRSTNEAQFDTSIQGSSATCYDPARNRIWAISINGAAAQLPYLDLSTMTHSSVATANSAGLGDTSQVACRNPVHDLFLHAGYVGPFHGTDVFTINAYDLSNPATGVHTLNLTGDSIDTQSAGSLGFDWDTFMDVGYVRVEGGSPDANHLYRVTPPSSSLLTAPWTVKKIQLPSAMKLSDTSGVNSNFMYIPTIRKFAHLTSVDDPVTFVTP